MPDTQQKHVVRASQRVKLPVNTASSLLHAPGIAGNTSAQGERQAWLFRACKLQLATSTVYNSP